MQNKLLILAGVVLSLGLGGCGGGSLESPPPVATTPTPMPTATATPEPTATPVSTATPVPTATPTVIDVELTTANWVTNPDTLTKEDVSGGVKFLPTAGDQQFYVVLDAATAVQGAGINMSLEADAAFVASDAEILVIVQQNGPTNFGGFFECNVTNDMLDASPSVTISADSCVVGDTAADTGGWRFGIQVIVAEGGTVAGGVSITNAQLVPAVGTTPTPTPTPEPTIDVELTAANLVTNPDTLVKEDVTGGVRFEPVAADQQLYAVLDAAAAVQGAGVNMSIEADADFIASDAEILVIVQQNGPTNFGGFFDCIVTNDMLDASGSVTISADTCVVGDAAADTGGWRFGIQVISSGTVAGGVTITNAQLVPAADTTPTPTPTATPEPTIDVELTAANLVTNPGTLVKEDVTGGVRFEPVAADQQLYAVLDAAAAVQGAGVNMSIEADADFIASDAEILIIVQQNGPTNFGGFFDCIVTNDMLDASGSVTISADTCVVGDAAADTGGWRFGIQVISSGTVAGGVTITNAQLVPASDGTPTP